jgi:hypothetical protein
LIASTKLCHHYPVAVFAPSEVLGMKAQKKSDLKLTMRQEAKRKVRPTTATPGGELSYRQDVEKGRRDLNRIGAEGGDTVAKKVKAELHYLIGNYLPAYDMRIEHLIDQWRRSGDPTYDPGIRVKLREARKHHMERNAI